MSKRILSPPPKKESNIFFPFYSGKTSWRKGWRAKKERIGFSNRPISYRIKNMNKFPSFNLGSLPNRYKKTFYCCLIYLSSFRIYFKGKISELLSYAFFFQFRITNSRLFVVVPEEETTFIVPYFSMLARLSFTQKTMKLFACR